jgi:adenylate cyclase class IV
VARNLEIKARVADLHGVRRAVSALAPSPGITLEQTDTFFVVPRGRLKVREFADGSGELIAYERPDQTGPKESVYTRVPCADDAELVRALGAVLPVRGQVRKRREVFIVGRTRVHLDEVERLGSFAELEVVLEDGESLRAGEAEAQALMHGMGLAPDALVPDAYIDLLERRRE